MAMHDMLQGGHILLGSRSFISACTRPQLPTQTRPQQATAAHSNIVFKQQRVKKKKKAFNLRGNFEKIEEIPPPSCSSA